MFITFIIKKFNLKLVIKSRIIIISSLKFYKSKFFKFKQQRSFSIIDFFLKNLQFNSLLSN